MSKQFSTSGTSNLSELLRRWHTIGIKPTPQRVLIYQILAESKSHPSADEILQEARKHYPALSLNTVYKTLEALAAKGEVTNVATDRAKTRFEATTAPHHHFHCRECGAIVDVDLSRSHRITLPAEYRQKFELAGFQVNFFGRCQRCKAAAAASSTRKSKHHGHLVTNQRLATSHKRKGETNGESSPRNGRKSRS